MMNLYFESYNIFRTQTINMRSNIVYIAPNQIPRSKTYRIPYDDLNEIPNAEQYFKQPLTMKELTKRNTQSNKQINFHRIHKMDSQNQESIDQKLQRETKKIKASFENQLNLHKRMVLDAENRLRNIQDEKNFWKQNYMKLKDDVDKGMIKNNGYQKHIHQTGQENNSHKANKAIQEQCSKLKVINSQLVAEMSKIRQQNKKLQMQVSKLQSQIVCNGIVRVDNNRKHQQAILKNTPTKVHQQRRSQSPLRHHPARSESPIKFDHINHQHQSPRHKSKTHHSNQNSLSMNDPNKEIQKLRKICGKMEKIIIERNEDIIKEKTKNLNMKYKNYA